MTVDRAHPAIHVAVVMGKMAGGGVEATVMNHYRHIDRDRVQFDFIVDANSTSVPKQEIESMGGRVFIVPPYKRLSAYVKECTRLFIQIKPDIVHSHVNALSVFPLYAAKRAGVPIRIAHSHSTSNPQEHLRNGAKAILKRFAKIYPTNYAACSAHAARWLFGDLSSDNGDVKLIKNALPLQDFSFSPENRNQVRENLGITPDQFVVGCVGRMSSQKNQLFAEDVFSQLHAKDPNALILFAGDGPLMEQVRRHAAELGITASVRFLGIRDDIPELYQAMDALLFPSLYEGLGMASIEAQAADLPVLASTEVPGETRLIPELIEYLSLDEPPSVWAEHLLSVATQINTQPGHPDRLRKNRSSCIAAAGYDIDDSAIELCTWYCELVSAQDTPRA